MLVISNLTHRQEMVTVLVILEDSSLTHPLRDLAGVVQAWVAFRVHPLCS